MCTTIKDSDSDGVFDDYAINNMLPGDYGMWHWTHICKKCVKDLCLTDFYLRDLPIELICGVKGCNNKAYYYYDFNGKEEEI